jgi:hypothetical protein
VGFATRFHGTKPRSATPSSPQISAINHEGDQGMMIVMTTWRDSAIMLGLAAVFGAVGGLVGQLMAMQQATAVSMASDPHKPDFGSTRWIANLLVGVLVGAAAAVTALYLLAPITNSTGTYDVIRLVASSLVVGTAGTAFITAAQMRLSAAVSDLKLDAMGAKMETMEMKVKMETMKCELAARSHEAPASGQTARRPSSSACA